MKRREQWRPVLDAEVKKWSAKPCFELQAELADVHCYQVEFEGGTYQVEVQSLENTNEYFHVGVSVDNGRIRASFRPLSTSFIREK